jgi:PGF-CTERM protein
MNNEKILSIFLTVLMVGSVFAFAVFPAGAQSESVDVSLQPSDGEIIPGEEQTFELVVEGATSGIGSYTIEVQSDDTSLLTIEDARAFQTSAGVFETDVADDGSSVSFSGLVQFDAQSSATLAEIDVAAADVEGESSLSVSVSEINDRDDGDSYDVDSENGSDVTVDEPDRDVTETDVLDFSVDQNDRTLVDTQAQHTSSAEFDQDNIQLFSEGNPTQQLEVTLDVAGNTGTETLLIDYSETADANVIANSFDIASGGPLDGAVTNTEVRNGVGELAITFDTAQTGDVVARTQEITVEWTVDPEETSIDPSGGDANVRHVAEIGGVGDDAFYRLTARGATAISGEDGEFDLSEEVLAENVQPTRQGGSGAFRIWQDQIITFQVPQNTDELSIWEYEVESQAGEPDQVVRGQRITRIGSAPGTVKNFDTGQLDANQRYLVDFRGTQEVAILDVDPLNLNVTAEDEYVENQDVELEVTSADTSGGTVTTFFFDDNFNFLHDEQTNLAGDGSATVRTNATEYLEGIDDYFAVVRHDESEVTLDPVSFSVVEAPDEKVTVASPVPEDDSFARGDIIPIELEFENTRTGTLTFGDRSGPQNLEINVTVRDLDEDGTATIYLNTFQIGDGAYTDDGEVVNTDDNRNHGFFTLDENTGLVGQAVAHGPSLDIEGGSQGGAVVFPQAYDLVTTSGEESYKAEDQFLNDRSIARIQPGSSEGVNLWTAPGIGENEIEPELEEDVTQLVEDGIITPADGQIAARDFMVLEADVTGLEGIMHEAVLQNDDLDVDDFLDREDDHLVTEEFFAAQNLTDRNGEDSLIDFSIRTQETNQSVQNRIEPNEAVTPLAIDIQQATTGVVAGTDDSGNLETYYIPIRLNPGTDLSVEELWLPSVPNDMTPSEAVGDPSVDVLFTSEDAPLTTPQEFNSTFILDTSDARQPNVPANGQMENGFVDSVSNWDFVRGEAFVDGAEPILVVPQEDGIEISGTTTVAAGTNLTINLATTPAEDPPFFKQNPTVFPEYVENESMNRWSITEDFAEFDVGTSFELTIRRTGSAGQLTYFTTPAGEDTAPVPGSVGEVREVQEFTFEDQPSGGQSVLVQSFQAPYDSVIEIQDSSGNVLGTSDVLPSNDSAQSRIAIPLDEAITENQEVTAVAMVAGGQEYPNGERTAEIIIEEQDEAEFSVSELDPQSAELEEPGETITVSATVTNEGDLEGSTDVALTLDGEEVDSQSVTLAGGASEEVSFDVNTGDLEPGTYIHGVSAGDDDTQGSLTIGQGSTPTETPTETETETQTDTPEDSDDGAGFGVVIALLAFMGVALLAARRRFDS